MSTTTIDRAAAIQAALAQALHPDSIVAHEGAFEIRICAGTACHASGRLAVRDAVVEELANRGLTAKVAVVETGCHGFCEQGPILVIQPKGIFYPHVRSQDVAAIIEQSVEGDGFVEKRLYRDPHSGEPVPYERDIPFYKGQHRLVLALNGKIDPYSIDDYLSHEGYAALANVLAGDDPDAVIELITESKLRGRGGAGFSTGTKWRFARQAKGETKYVICNADEGDPGAFMDRSVLEGNPHAVLEGMMIAAFAIGAHEDVAYVRAEYPFAVARLRAALVQARERGLLGLDILGSGFAFDVRISEGAGAFVCGEETALIASIEGKRGMPRTRPPFPAVSGLWGRPTNINNVETFANIPWIMTHGAEAFAAMGVGESRGTKIFSLTGKVANGGLVEVPMGATLRHIRDELDAHISERRRPAGQCKALITYYIDAEACTGCMLCAKKCPTSCISGEKKQPHVIDVSSCIKCDTCRQVCKFDAVKVWSGIEQAAAATGQEA